MKYPICKTLVLTLLFIFYSLQAQPNWDNRNYKRIAWFDTLYQAALQIQQNFLNDQKKVAALQKGTWYYAGPFNAVEETLFEEEFAPEKTADTSWKNVALIEGKVFRFENINEPAVIYLKSNFRTDATVQLPLYFGTSNAYKIWLEGSIISQNEDNDEFAIDQDVISLSLQKGENNILIKLVCYDNPPTLYLSFKPAKLLTKMMDDRLQKLFHATTNDAEKRKMYWEAEDNVWDLTISDTLFRHLARNYLKEIDKDFMLYNLAQTITKNVSNENDLQVVRHIYTLAKFNYQKEYIAVNYAVDDENWQAYKNTYNTLINQASALLENYSDGHPDAVKKWNAFFSGFLETCERMPIRLPSTPMQAGPFGAYYTKLKYYPDWDKKWRVADHPDVLVRFPDEIHKFIFWRGTNYIPHWITEKGFWFTNEFNETWFSVGSAEPMSDKQCRYSHVRIIENNSARVIIHWRYALNDVNYDIAWPDKYTGWGDWSDEYYIIYPDAVGVRKVILHTSHFRENPVKGTDEAGHEWQEGIVVYHPYTRPEDYLNIDAVHVANMKGESAKWSWAKPGEPITPTPEGSNIVMMNMKSRYKPFIISQEGCRLAAYAGAQGGSHFRWRDHWPTTTEPTPGRDADGTQAAHGSFFHVLDIPYYDKEPNKLTKIMLHGLTKTSVDGLVPVAKSWLHPPDLIISTDTRNVIYDGYDLSERAHIFTIKNKKNLKNIELNIMADPDNPAINPVIIVNNWNADKPQIKLNGLLLEKDTEYTVGIESDLNISRLVVWVNKELTRPSRFLIQ